jgi:hypothetical protein
MSAWWEQGYPGGPMVLVAGFPRPLYPPDASAHGKKPSMDGPDVVAYKRTVSRAGRWPWAAFDDSYSNGFAHGKGGNVIDTGVAGVQRQQDVDDTGWIGQKTFNTLRSIRIPDGLPHAGEPAMDATAVQLVNEAFAMFGGKEPASEPGAKINLGPVDQGGTSVRDYDLTHATSGIPLYPAFDAVWHAGQAVVAPEPLVVTRTGGASHGVAFYADGDSGLRWWLGHLAASPNVGRRFARGEVVGSVAPHPEAPHVHVGINVERLWGSGQQMTHRTNYTHGAPLVGKQLDAGCPL